MFQAKIFTLYPEYFPGPFEIGICKKAFEKKLWDLKLINIRDYADDKHKTCLLYTSPSPRDWTISRMPSSA